MEISSIFSMKRRDFIRAVAVILASGGLDKVLAKTNLSSKFKFTYVPPYAYENISTEDSEWVNVSPGIDFRKTKIYGKDKLVDIVATAKINPEKNRLKVFNNYTPQDCPLLTIEEWQKRTGASLMFNSAMYEVDKKYFGAPRALIISNGKPKFPVTEHYVSGMIVAEPTDHSLPKIDLLDLRYDHFDLETTPYTEGVQHWMILLDRDGKIPVKASDWQSNRTIVAKDKNKNFIVMTTEGGFFTLYNFGRFLKEKKDLEIECAMNLDGGYEAQMCINTPTHKYATYGQFETYGPDKNVSVLNARCQIPAAIGIFPRK